MSAKGNLTRQRIIEKSMQLFSVKGYFNTSISDIEKATGLTKGGIYGHFRNKQEIWYAVYEECARVWRRVVFDGVKEISDPLARINKVLENSLKKYLGGGVFEGGCFFLNSLLDVAGQSPTMRSHIMQGFQNFSKLLGRWLEEARQQGMLREDLDIAAVADFLVISLNGAAPLFAASRDPAVWQRALGQLQLYLQGLRKAQQIPAGLGSFAANKKEESLTP